MAEITYLNRIKFIACIIGSSKRIDDQLIDTPDPKKIIDLVALSSKIDSEGFSLNVCCVYSEIHSNSKIVVKDVEVLTGKLDHNG
jgi:hypothetical protein